VIEIKVESNARELAMALGELAQRQIPFATAKALTRTAQSARDEIRSTLGDYFKLRAKARMERGITIERAEKRDWPNCAAKVGTLDEFLVPHVLGGIKRPQRGAKTVAIPARWLAARRTSTGRIPKALKPRQLREKEGTVVTEDAIKRRTGRRTKLRQLQIAYLRRPKVQIKARWPFPDLAGTAARKTYPEHFQRELTAAVESAKRFVPTGRLKA
jgi:hypothetical protein